MSVCCTVPLNSACPRFRVEPSVAHSRGMMPCANKKAITYTTGTATKTSRLLISLDNVTLPDAGSVMRTPELNDYCGEMRTYLETTPRLQDETGPNLS